jgi:hypothetical protein
MRSHLPRILLALGLPVLCWTFSGCGGGDDATATTGTSTPADPVPVDSGDMSSESADAAHDAPGSHDAPGGTHDETYADAGSPDGSETPMPGAHDEGMPPGAHDEGTLPGAHEEGAAPEAPGEIPMPGVEPMPGAHGEGPLPGTEPPGEEPMPPGEAPGEPMADGAHGETPAGDVPADPTAVAPGGEIPTDGAPGGELDPAAGGAAADKLPDVPEDSAAWPAVELIRRVRDGKTDAIAELLYPGQRRGLVGELASEKTRDEAVTKLKTLFSEILPLGARQIDANHEFTVLNSKESAKIEFTVRRTKSGFVVYSINSRKVSEGDLKTMLQGVKNGSGAGGAGGGNTGGY